MTAPVTILSAVLDAATKEAAIGTLQKDLTWLAASGFNLARVGNLAFELREIAEQYVAALKVVETACAVECADNVTPMRRKSL